MQYLIMLDYCKAKKLKALSKTQKKLMQTLEEANRNSISLREHSSLIELCGVLLALSMFGNKGLHSFYVTDTLIREGSC